MFEKPQSLFQLFGILQNSNEEEFQDDLRDGFGKWMLWARQAGRQAVPNQVQVAYDILQDRQTRRAYIAYLDARGRDIPLRFTTDELPEVRRFCKAALLCPWVCPEGLLGEDGQPAALGEALVRMRFDGEPSPWRDPQPLPPAPPERRALWPKVIVLTAVVAAAITGWQYAFAKETPEQLAADIRQSDAAFSDRSAKVSKEEAALAAQFAAVVGPLPSDGSLPMNLARVCFEQRTTARAWESLQARDTKPADLADVRQTVDDIERRIAMGSFLESDKKFLTDANLTLRRKLDSFTELHEDLDLLSVVLEAERTKPRTETQTRASAGL